jgi:hypothetical protein
MPRVYETRVSYEEYETYRESFSKGELKEEDIKKLVVAGKLTPSQYKTITRKVYSMYKDVRRDLIQE